MSVINQMLRDLEARSAQDPARRAALAAAGVPLSRPSRPRRRAWNVLRWILPGLAGLGLAAWWWQGREVAGGAQAARVETVAGSAVAPSAPATPLPAVAETPSAAPAEETLALPAAEPADAPGVPASPPAPPAPPAPAAPPAPPAPPEVAGPAPAAQAPPAPSPPAPPRRQSIERIAPPAPPPLLEAARAALAEGRADEALALLEGQATPSPEAEALTAAALQQLGRHAEAAARYRRALAREGDVGAWWAGLAISLEAEGQGAEALEAYRQAQRRGPLEAALADYVRARVSALAAEPPR
ncbi:hypothetical protein [Silanimonas lenta]|uniref:hypothetical protein n=1 Tax=Silanimonas lenta TaxID=265429 RepID=UPI0003FBFEF0|nr:hypothetical protein [Silanimonas lenta]